MAVATSGMAGSMPMPAMNAVAAPVTPVFATSGAESATFSGVNAGSGTGPFYQESSRQSDGGAGIGIDLGCESVRVAVWNAETCEAEAIVCGENEEEVGMPCAMRVNASKVEAGIGTAYSIVGVQRLLGRSFGSLAGSKYLEAEGQDFIGAAIEPADEADPHVRLRVVCERPAPSGLKKRGSGAAPPPSKDRSKTVDRVLAPEDLMYKVLLAAKQRAEAALDSEVTDAVIAVPSHWGARQRQAAFDCAVMANLQPLCVVSAAVAMPLPEHSAFARADSTSLVVDFGAGALSISAMRAGRVVEVGGDEEAGGLAMDRKVARVLTEQFRDAEDLDLSSDENRLAILRAAGALKCLLFPIGSDARREASVQLRLTDRNGAPVEKTAKLSATEWTAAVADSLAAIEALLARVIRAAEVPSSVKLRVLAGGEEACKSAAVRGPLVRALGDPGTHEVTWLSDTPEGASATACGAALIAAARMQPRAVQDALGEDWRELQDALPVSILVEGADGVTTRILERLCRVGSTRTLNFDAASSELVVKIAEGAVAPNGALHASPLLDAIVSPSAVAGRSLVDILLGRAGAKATAAPPQRTVTVQFAPTGVVDCDCDSGLGGDDHDGDDTGGAVPTTGRLGVTGVLLLLMLIASSLLAVAPTGPSPSTMPHANAEAAPTEPASNSAGEQAAESGMEL